ncbi:MAG: hypothetical protein AAF654_09840 [Myxococcota bacterium]
MSTPEQLDSEAATRKWVLDFINQDKAAFLSLVGLASAGIGFCLLLPWVSALGLEWSVVLSRPSIAVAAVTLSFFASLVLCLTLVAPAILTHSLGSIPDNAPKWFPDVWLGFCLAAPTAIAVLVIYSLDFVHTAWLILSVVAVSSLVLGILAKCRLKGLEPWGLLKLVYDHLLTSAVMLLPLVLFLALLPKAQTVGAFFGTCVAAALVAMGIWAVIRTQPGPKVWIGAGIFSAGPLFLAGVLWSDNFLVERSRWIHQRVGFCPGERLISFPKAACEQILSVASAPPDSLKSCSPFVADVLFRTDGLTVIDADFLEGPLIVRHTIELEGAPGSGRLPASLLARPLVR